MDWLRAAYLSLRGRDAGTYEAVQTDEDTDASQPAFQRSPSGYVAFVLATCFCLAVAVLSCFPSSSARRASNSLPPLSLAVQSALNLNQSVCRREFPLLYPQLEDLKAHWLARGGITKQNVDRLEAAAATDGYLGWGRIIAKDGKVWVRSFQHGPDTRQTLLLGLLNQAMANDPDGWTTTGDRMPALDLMLSTADLRGFPGYPDGPGWVLSRDLTDPIRNGSWLAPDFGFAGWPEIGAPVYTDVVALERKQDEESPWAGKDDRAFWRGFPNQYLIRQDLMQRTRQASHLTPQDPNAWADVYATSFHGDEGPEFRPLVKLEDHCKRKYLLHSEGNSYSGRSKYLFNCHSVVIAHPLNWTQHFHPALLSDPSSADQNMVTVPGPLFQGLEETVRGLWESDNSPKTASAKTKWLAKAKKMGSLGVLSAEQIADNARDSLRDRYLAPAATMCYFRAALRHTPNLKTCLRGSLGPAQMSPRTSATRSSIRRRSRPGHQFDLILSSLHVHHESSVPSALHGKRRQSISHDGCDYQ